MQDRPSVDELLEAVAGFLQNDVMPNTTGRLNFHARVSSNVIQMLRRELSLEEEHFAREWAGLDLLLGAQERPPSLAEWRHALVARNDALSGRIRAGDADSGEMHIATLAPRGPPRQARRLESGAPGPVTAIPAFGRRPCGYCEAGGGVAVRRVALGVGVLVGVGTAVGGIGVGVAGAVVAAGGAGGCVPEGSEGGGALPAATVGVDVGVGEAGGGALKSM
jgi:hypothetical protein